MRKASLYLSLFFIFFSSCQLKKQNKPTLTVIPADSIITHINDTITLLFVGDVMQHKAQLEAAQTKKGFDYSSYYQYVKKEIQSSDISTCNLETPIGAPPYAGYPMFSAPSEFAQEIKSTGFNLILTANNHCVDRHAKGLRRTIEVLDSLDLKHLGTYINKDEQEKNHPHYISINNKKIAFLNYTYGTNGIGIPNPFAVNLIDTIQIKQDLEKAKINQSNAIIVCIHWGEEYITSPNKQQKKLANWMIKNGADHIIGAHPHVIQPIKIYKDSVNQKQHIVAYSLGNFISNMSQIDTDGGMILKLKLFGNQKQMDSEVSYSLVWTGRPSITGEKNYILFPISHEKDSLNSFSYNKLSIFKQRAQKVMQANSPQVKYYDF